MADIYNIFYILILRKHLKSGDQDFKVDFKDLNMQKNSSIGIDPIKILDSQDKSAKRKWIYMVKVQWSKIEKEVTWELEGEI